MTPAFQPQPVKDSDTKTGRHCLSCRVGVSPRYSEDLMVDVWVHVTTGEPQCELFALPVSDE